MCKASPSIVGPHLCQRPAGPRPAEEYLYDLNPGGGVSGSGGRLAVAFSELILATASAKDPGARRVRPRLPQRRRAQRVISHMFAE